MNFLYLHYMSINLSIWGGVGGSGRKRHEDMLIFKKKKLSKIKIQLRNRSTLSPGHSSCIIQAILMHC